MSPHGRAAQLQFAVTAIFTNVAKQNQSTRLLFFKPVNSLPEYLRHDAFRVYSDKIIH